MSLESQPIPPSQEINLGFNETHINSNTENTMPQMQSQTIIHSHVHTRDPDPNCFIRNTIDPKEWLKQIDDYSEARNINDEKMVKNVSKFLGTDENKWFEASGPFANFSAFKAKFLEDYPSKSDPEIRREIENFKQGNLSTRRVVIEMLSLYNKMEKPLDELTFIEKVREALHERARSDVSHTLTRVQELKNKIGSLP